MSISMALGIYFSVILGSERRHKLKSEMIWGTSTVIKIIV